MICRIFFCLSFYLVNTCVAQDTVVFKPKVEHYKGYLNEVLFKSKGHWYFFFAYSEKHHKNVRFRFKRGRFWISKKYKIIFWGTTIHEDVRQLYGPISQHEWLKSTPYFEEEDEIEVGRLFKRYIISTIPTGFSAFNYSEYKEFEKRLQFPALRLWGIYGKTIYPEMITSNTEYLIVTRFDTIHKH